MFFGMIFRYELCACCRRPPTFEQHVISVHLSNLLHCNLDELPVEILTDNFITSSHMSGILPKKLATNYTKCLHQNKAHSELIGAFSCKTLIKQPCTYMDGSKEQACFQRLHGTNYVSAKSEMSTSSVNSTKEDIQDHYECLQKVAKRAGPCLKTLISQCKKSFVRATKLVRFFLQTSRYLLQKDPYVKFIYYVRDPRGTLESRFRRGNRDLKKEENIALLAKHSVALCSKMEADYLVYRELTLTSPDNIMLVRYEDFATDTFRQLDSVYKFIGDKVPSGVLEFFHKATAHTNDGNAMNTVRKNSTETSSMWKKQLPSHIIAMIQAICGQAMHNFGYQAL